MVVPVKKSCDQRLFTIKDVANYLHRSPWMIRNLIHRGELPVVKFGENGTWLIDILDLDELIRRNKTLKSIA